MLNHTSTVLSAIVCVTQLQLKRLQLLFFHSCGAQLFVVTLFHTLSLSVSVHSLLLFFISNRFSLLFMFRDFILHWNFSNNCTSYESHCVWIVLSFSQCVRFVQRCVCVCVYCIVISRLFVIEYDFFFSNFNCCAYVLDSLFCSFHSNRNSNQNSIESHVNRCMCFFCRYCHCWRRQQRGAWYYMTDYNTIFNEKWANPISLLFRVRFYDRNQW